MLTVRAHTTRIDKLNKPQRMQHCSEQNKVIREIQTESEKHVKNRPLHAFLHQS